MRLIMAKQANEKKEEAKRIIKEKQEETRKIAKKTMDEYKKFAIKGNAIDLAIGVVIGTAFTNIVNTIVSSVITPVISLITNNNNLSSLFITLKGGKFETIEEARNAGAIIISYGDLINAIINFFIISFVLFIIVSILKKMNKKDAKKEEQIAKTTTKKCPYCLSDIKIEATRCPYCTSILDEKIKPLVFENDDNTKEINNSNNN